MKLDGPGHPKSDTIGAMIDVSQFNGRITWSNVSHRLRVLVRVTYGAGGVDTLGRFNLAASRAGHRTGAYHFLEDGDGAAEVENFLAHFTPVPGGLRGMIDVEPSAYSHPTTERVVAAVQAYREHTGHDPIVYGTHDVLSALHLPASIGSCPLMLAGYGPNDGAEHPPGAPPPPWHSIAVHQYTSVGTVPGVPSHVDLSRVYDGAAITVPKPRPIIGRWRVSYVDPAGHATAVVTRTPVLWLRVHPRVKYRGAVTITPHRR